MGQSSFKVIFQKYVIIEYVNLLYSFDSIYSFELIFLNAPPSTHLSCFTEFHTTRSVSSHLSDQSVVLLKLTRFRIELNKFE